MIIDIILILIIIALMYAVYNLMNKNTKYEVLYNLYDDKMEIFIDSLFNTINKMNEIDSKGLFKSDDEVGFIWNDLKDAINELKEEIQVNLYDIHYEDET